MPPRVPFRAIVVGLCLLAAPPSVALGARTGGAAVAQPGAVASAACGGTSSWTCSPGAQLTLRGEELGGVASIVFLGGRGQDDDRTAQPSQNSRRAIVVRVPQSARSGPLRLLFGTGEPATTRSSIQLGDDASGAVIDELPRLSAAAFKLFAGSRKPVVFAYRAESAGDGTIEVVNMDTGVVARSWATNPDEAGNGAVRWDGTTNGVPVATGRYGFRVAGNARAAATAPAAGTSFAVYPYLFPIRGRHDLGQTATNGFGGARDHKGQDMFARCGTPLAATTNGRVKFAGYEAAAGNYVVVQGADGRSHVLMHMRDVPLVRTGERVFTGQRVGFVGETGRASGCHLHFELWTNPGWYEGGTPIDPLPSLQAWDSYS